MLRVSKPISQGLDLLIVRELTGGIYFGEPRSIRTLDNGEQQGYNTMVYSTSEISVSAKSRLRWRRLTPISGKPAKICSVDKANVLEVTELWNRR